MAGTAAADRPNRIPWPPLVYLAAVLAGLALQFVLPLPWPGGAARLWLAVLGVCALVGGLTLDAVATLAFRRHRTTILPHRAATALITDGPFAWTRNPIYTGNTAMVAGAGFLLANAWLLLAAVAAAVAVQRLAVGPEERHLAARFGSAWDDYAARTPRWLFW